MIPRFLVVGLFASVLFVNSAIAYVEPKTEPNLRDVISRMDEILRRLEKIEQRIARLERVRSLPVRLRPDRFRPDKHGFLNDASGRVIGIWGIDNPSVNQRHPDLKARPLQIAPPPEFSVPLPLPPAGLFTPPPR